MSFSGAVHPSSLRQSPSLWEEPPKHPIHLSKQQMESLAAICDTFLPSIDPPPGSDDPSIAVFYRTSATMANVHERIGGMLSGGLQHPQTATLRLALWLLSTWYGTLLLCGRRSLSRKFPFVRRFTDVELEKREEILFAWATSCFRLLKMLYFCVKCITMRLYFAQINEKMENPSWKAIGYSGPNRSPVDQSQPIHEEERKDHLFHALLHMNASPELISGKLRRVGFPSPTTPTTLHCDAVVVGSGSGGSVVAAILSSAGHKVLLLEKGYYHSRSELSHLEGPSTAAMYEDGGFVATDDVSVIILAGSTVGGGSTINWSACIPTPDNVRREWSEEHRLRLFESEEYDRALEAVCRRMGVQSRVDEEGFNNEVLRRGCTAVGYPVTAVPCNAPPDHYCGFCHLGCKDGKKQSAKETWLDDMARSGNGLILPGCRAVKILRKQGKARLVADGVVAELSDGFRFTIKSKVTVVACGALNTPRLLKRSGLRNKHIGKNLHLHPTVMAWGYFPEAADGGFPEKGKKSYQGGILTSMSRPEGDRGFLLQTPALHPGMFAALVPWFSAADFRRRMLRFSRTASVFALVRDTGRGEAGEGTWKRVRHRLSLEDDVGLKKGLEAAVRVVAAAGAAEVGTQWVGVGERTGMRLGDLRTPMCSAHQMGTCRMGVVEGEGAVGMNGEAWEMEGLFVADSSVFPTALGVNPMMTVMAVAYCIAKFIDMDESGGRANKLGQK
ncbi:hypothetical protein HPP92_002552 [Vanilla planifolia]|uniref:Long-chain-alcohol oxidase n=1 Tax=Vanilla planifolia TaxID=51239 RepID=A0A835VIL6_VANPL|nr:hypothetical protein HPP92_002552 [Vanilla planifolia]